ncbi:MAG: c-type cytochrome [Gammaproteobacteria bacterium]|nr:c-type cytochrome [Gammaproteobacteria bacterium]
MLQAETPDVETIAEGGRIYDKWWAEMQLRKPNSTHPAYPSTGKKRGAATWRCKECHGWDYRGRNGAYSQGSHYSGIKGIRAYAGGDEDKVFAILKDRTHRYDDVMLDGALKVVAAFVVHGQVDTSQYIDDNSKLVIGNAQRGASLFNDNCARCHHDDGRAIDFADGDKTEYIGTLANKNPWETLHKIRHGHPGSSMRMHHRGGMGMMHGRWRPGESMPAMLGELTLAEQIDLLAYTQTLPKD